MQVNEMLIGGLTAQDWFGWAGQLVMIGWVILVFMPRRIKPLFFVAQYLIPMSLGLLYSGLALTHYFTSDGGYGSIKQVRELFSNDFMLLAGWVHYLAFDLFVGAWISKKADTLGVSRILQAPILIATLMFGPVGLVLFLSMRMVFIRSPTAAIKTSSDQSREMQYV